MMTRLIGIAIILAGATSFLFGASPLLAIAVALRDGKPVPYWGGGNTGLLIGVGISMIAYGWHCVKGFKK